MTLVSIADALKRIDRGRKQIEHSSWRLGRNLDGKTKRGAARRSDDYRSRQRTDNIVRSSILRKHLHQDGLSRYWRDDLKRAADSSPGKFKITRRDRLVGAAITPLVAGGRVHTP